MTVLCPELMLVLSAQIVAATLLPPQVPQSWGQELQVSPESQLPSPQYEPHDALETEQVPPQAHLPVLVCPQDEGIVALQVFESIGPPQVPQASRFTQLGYVPHWLEAHCPGHALLLVTVRVDPSAEGQSFPPLATGLVT